MNNRYYLTIVLVLSMLITASIGWAAPPTAKIIIEPMSTQKIKDLGLPGPDTTSVTAGINVVGAGTQVYLRAGGTDPDGGEITRASWSLGSIPGGSAATLTPGPVEGLYTLKTDVVGDYTVQLTVTDAQGETSEPVTQTITAANYVGIANCKLCHNGLLQPDAVTPWSETKHATMLQEGVDGIKSDRYGQGCIRCHTVGYDTNPAANNGGFDDVMKATGWTFPTELKEGNFAAVPANLQNVSNIQCESCHGPGSQHMGVKAKIAVGYETGVCGTCHDALTHHIFPYQWDQSKHAEAVDESGPGREGCVKCHTGRGFIEYVKAGAPGLAYRGTDVEYSPINCQACHDPHSAANEKQLRRVADVTLENGEVVTTGGTGKLCMTCHHSRRNAPEYVKRFSRRFGPHGNPQADMFTGKNAIDYGETIPSSSHQYATENGCVTCHMGETPGSSEPGWNKVGAHTYKVKWDGGTPDDPSDDVENVKACESCHGPMEDFDKPAGADFDGNGEIDGVQTEVKGLLTKLALLLPPVGENSVVVDSLTYTPERLKAAYNYFFVLNDGSYGIHNTKYAVGLLRASIRDLGGQIITSVEEDAARPGVPKAYELAQNAPNPFNPETTIRYSLPTAGTVHLTIYSIAGQKVIDLVNERQEAGFYTVRWGGLDEIGRQVAAGVYLYSLRSEGYTAARKMVLLP
jgi:PKD repeat protein